MHILLITIVIVAIAFLMYDTYTYHTVRETIYIPQEVDRGSSDYIRYDLEKSKSRCSANV